MILVLFVAHVALCLYLFASVFARAVLMDKTVHADVRLVFCLAGIAALWGLGAPIVTGWVPDAYSIMVTAAFCAVQAVTGRYWQGRVPDRFRRPGSTPRNRRSTDTETSQ